MTWRARADLLNTAGHANIGNTSSPLPVPWSRESLRKPFKEALNLLHAKRAPIIPFPVQCQPDLTGCMTPPAGTLGAPSKSVGVTMADRVTGCPAESLRDNIGRLGTCHRYRRRTACHFSATSNCPADLRTPPTDIRREELVARHHAKKGTIPLRCNGRAGAASAQWISLDGHPPRNDSI